MALAVSLLAITLLARAEIAVAVLAFHLSVAELLSMSVVAVSLAADMAFLALAVVTPTSGAFDDASGSRSFVTSSNGGRGLVSHKED